MRYLEDYLVQLGEARQLSEHTLLAYGTDLRDFAGFLGAAAEEPSRITTRDVKRYVARLLEEGKERTTVARHLAAIKGYFHFLLVEGLNDDDPAAAIRTPRLARRLPHVLDTAQIERLLAAPAGEAFLAVRDRAILETLYSAGLRVSELVGLDLDRLDLKRGLVTVLGKGRKERLALLGSHAVAAVEAWLPHRRARIKDRGEPALWINVRGTRLSDRSVRRMLDRYLAKADLPSTVSPHTLRHSFATHLLQSGAGLKEVQELLGHAHLSSTQVYTHVSPDHLRRVYESSHPRAVAT